MITAQCSAGSSCTASHSLGACPRAPAQLQRWRRQGGAAALSGLSQPCRSLQAAAAHQLQRRPARLVCRAAACPQIDVEAARKALDTGSTVLDIRSEVEWEAGRITKPPRRAVNVPFAAGDDTASFVAQVAAKFPNAGAKLIVMCGDGGANSAEATEALLAAGYSAAAQLAGGWAAYTQVWGPSGKRRPPAGRWVSTGKEALKSGLNIPGVAESYDEGGNATVARYAKGLPEGDSLLPPLQQ